MSLVCAISSTDGETSEVFAKEQKKKLIRDALLAQRNNSRHTHFEFAWRDDGYAREHLRDGNACRVVADGAAKKGFGALRPTTTEALRGYRIAVWRGNETYISWFVREVRPRLTSKESLEIDNIEQHRRRSRKQHQHQQQQEQEEEEDEEEDLDPFPPEPPAVATARWEQASQVYNNVMRGIQKDVGSMYEAMASLGESLCPTEENNRPKFDQRYLKADVLRHFCCGLRNKREASDVDAIVERSPFPHAGLDVIAWLCSICEEVQQIIRPQTTKTSEDMIDYVEKLLIRVDSDAFRLRKVADWRVDMEQLNVDYDTPLNTYMRVLDMSFKSLKEQPKKQERFVCAIIRHMKHVYTSSMKGVVHPSRIIPWGAMERPRGPEYETDFFGSLAVIAVGQKSQKFRESGGRVWENLPSFLAVLDALDHFSRCLSRNSDSHDYLRYICRESLRKAANKRNPNMPARDAVSDLMQKKGWV